MGRQGGEGLKKEGIFNNTIQKMLLQMHREKGLSKDERTVITKSF